MAKLRLKLANIEIIMSKIVTVIIDGVEFKKETYSGGHTKILQDFYMFIKKHHADITFICFRMHSSDDHLNYLYLKDGKKHNIDYKAYFTRMIDVDYDFGYGGYFIDGEKLTEQEWRKKSRKIKLIKLSELI